MFPVRMFLVKKAPETQKIYLRSLTLFANHVGCDVDHLTDYLTSPRDTIIGDLVTFSDSLSKGNLGQNTQRHMMAAIMSYLSYNEIIIPKPHKQQIVPRKGRPRQDKAFTRANVKRIFDVMQSPIGKTALLLMFTTGMRITECVSFKEEDLEKRVIHLQDVYCKGNKGRDVVMTTECADYLYNIWLPRKQEYLKSAQNKNIGIRKGPVKSLEDDRVIPCTKMTLYEILMTGFRAAGFDEQKNGYFLYHPHSLRKSFRSIVGSVNIDLAEHLMGHQGYLSNSYVRFDSVIEDYDKVAGLLTIHGDDPSLKGRLEQLEEKLREKDEMFQQFAIQLAMQKFVMEPGSTVKLKK